jgi:3-dehydroquinate synthase
MDSAAARLEVTTAGGSYFIQIGAGLLAQAGEAIRAAVPRAASRVMVVSQPSIQSLYQERLHQSLHAAGFQPFWHSLPEGEAAKSFAHYNALMEALLAERPDRHTTLVALGGGVVGDMTGFAAATLLRGVPFVQIPTTLLAQVDSSVGGKTGINSAQGKNLVGAFYQPRLVLADTQTLQSLPMRERKAGYAEVLKYALLGDAGFFDWLEAHGPDVLDAKPEALRHAILTSCQMKAAIVSRDEKETGERALLNLGHSFGHALEAAFGYDGRLLHGEAVAIGMIYAARFSHRRGLVGAEVPARIQAHLERLGLPVAPPPLPEGVTPEWLARAMLGDKKNSNGKLTLILLEALGKAVITPGVDYQEVVACWQQP